MYTIGYVRKNRNNSYDMVFGIPAVIHCLVYFAMFKIEIISIRTNNVLRTMQNFFIRD